MADAIDTAMTTPQSASSPAGSVNARSIRDLIEADRYQAAKTARAKATQGIIFSKLLPAAANPDQQGTNTGDGSSANFDQG